MTDGWWRPGPEGVSLRVRVQPRARRPGIGGLAPGVDGPPLRLAVTKTAEDGRAKRAVCAALATALSLLVSAVNILQGLAAREKLVQVAGNAETLAARVRYWA